MSWSHFVEVIPLADELKREFYAEMCRVERWSVRTLRKKIDGMLYERTALSRKPEALIRQELAALREDDRLSPDLVFRDPYFLDFLGLQDTFAEKDLEAAILRDLEAFLLELGVGFTFVARQKRITVDREDYYIDLLFYHRKLRRLVAVELKMGTFKAADKGQLELYLRWLEKYEMEPGRGGADRAHPLCGQVGRARRAAPARRERDPGGVVPDGNSRQRSCSSGNSTSRPSGLGRGSMRCRPGRRTSSRAENRRPANLAWKSSD